MSNHDVKVEYNMPFDDYLAVDAMSSTAIKRLYTSYRDYFYMISNCSKDTLERGRAIHKILLEYEDFFSSYTLFFGGKDKRAKGYKTAKKEADLSGRTLLTMKEFKEYMRIRWNFLQNPDAVRYSKGEHEVSVFWNDYQFGPAKARFDILVPHKFAGDLKTISPWQFMSFGRQAYNLGYDIQAAWYLRAANAAGFSEVEKGDKFQFVFVTVESTGLYNDSSVQIVPEEMIIGGEEKIKQALENLETVYAYEAAGIENAFYGKIPGVSFVDYRLEQALS